MKSFSSFHPIVLFLYYVSVMFVTMFTMHPFILLCSLVGAWLFFCMMNPLNIILKDLAFYFLLFLLIAVTNPLFSHNGETILFFLNDNPVTLEAIIYGIAIAGMLSAVIFWSKSYSDVMTSDKFIYLFGKAIPKLSLVLSMALRFVPLFKGQIKKVHRAQKTLGLYSSQSMTDRLLSSMRVFNSIVTWSLENAIHQADSMKARGYGLKGRTNFSLFRLYKRDVLLLGMILLMLAGIVWSLANGRFAFHYYPYIASFHLSILDVWHLIVVILLMVIPFVIEVKENIQWKLLRSKM